MLILPEQVFFHHKKSHNNYITIISGDVILLARMICNVPIWSADDVHTFIRHGDDLYH